MEHLSEDGTMKENTLVLILNTAEVRRLNSKVALKLGIVVKKRLRVPGMASDPFDVASIVPDTVDLTLKATSLRPATQDDLVSQCGVEYKSNRAYQALIRKARKSCSSFFTVLCSLACGCLLYACSYNRIMFF